MKTKLPFSIALLGLASMLQSQAVQIDIADFSLTPDGTTGSPTQITDIATPNGGNVLGSSPSTAYFVTTFTFGAGSDARLETQFLAGNGAGRIGIQVQDNGNVTVPGTGGQLLDYDGLTDQTSPSSYSFGQDMAGQTVVIVAKLQFDVNNSTTYNVRFGNGNPHGGADTLMNVWFNPTGSSVEGSGPSAGDLFAIWNSSSFASFEQQIFNQSTPGTAGESSITNTVILTGENATFANALALATGGATPDVFNLIITRNATTPGSYDFSWESVDGKVYDLVSSTDLSTPPATWSVHLGNENIPATAPTNSLMDVAGGGDPARFFAMIEKDPPPLLSENFDAAAALPAGWVSNGPSNGTDWEVGTPSGVASGPAAASSPEYCAGTNIDGYYTENADVSLISPSFAVPAGSGAILTFQHFIDTDLNGVPHDLGSVRILDADNADAPIAGLEIAGIEGDGTAGWTEQTLDLPLADVEGKNLKVEFRFVTNAGTTPDADVWSGFYIDDVLVESVTP